MVLLAEFQIIFESSAYLSPNFLLNADFQNVKLYFHPLYFFAMRKWEGIAVLKRIYVVLCHFKRRFGSILQHAIACGIILQTFVFVITLIIMQRKGLTICRQTDRQMNIVNPEF